MLTMLFCPHSLHSCYKLPHKCIVDNPLLATAPPGDGPDVPHPREVVPRPRYKLSHICIVDNPLRALQLPLAMALMYPTLEKWSPARGDTTLILGVGCGISLGHWVSGHCVVDIGHWVSGHCLVS